MKKRLFLIFAGLLLVFGLIVGGSYLLPKPVDVCKNIDGTQETIPDGFYADGENCLQPKTINVTGAQPTFGDPDIQKVLANKYRITVNVLSNSNLTEYKNSNGDLDFNNISAIFGGSTSFPEEFKTKYTVDGKLSIPTSGDKPITIIYTQTTFSSPLIPFIKTKNLQAFLDSGLVQKSGNQYIISGENAAKIAHGVITDQYWSELGVKFPSDSLVRVGYPYPGSSGGGKTIFSYLLGCELVKDAKPCSKTINIDQINANIDLVQKLKLDYGSQPGGDNSVSYWFDWANSSNAGQKMVFGNESIIFSWLSSANVPASQIEAAKKSITGIYPEYTFMTTQAAIAFDENGKNLVNIMTSDPDIIAIMNNKLGQRVGFGGVLPKTMDWISQEDTFTTIVDPSSEVTSKIGSLFK